MQGNEYLEKAFEIEKSSGDTIVEATDRGKRNGDLSFGTKSHLKCEHADVGRFQEKNGEGNRVATDNGYFVVPQESLEKGDEASKDDEGEAADYEKRFVHEYGNVMEDYAKALLREASSYRDLGTVSQSRRQYGKAREYLEKALAIRKEIGDKSEEATEYENLGTVLRSLGEHEKAKEYHEKALAIRKDIGDRKGEATNYAHLGTVFLSLAEHVKANEYNEKALAISKEIGDRRGEATGYGNLGSSCHFLGEFEKAREYHETALAIRREIHDIQGIALSFENLGTLSQSLGEYCKAQEYHKKALAIRKETGDREGEARVYEYEGIVFHSLCEHDKAKEYHEKALAIRKENGDKKGEASSCENLATVFQSLGQTGKTKENLEKALLIRKEIGDRKGEATSYGNLGVLFQSIGEYLKAKDYLEKALKIKKQIGDKEGEAADYANLGNSYRSLGDFGKAKEYHENALKIRKETGDIKGEAADYENLGTVLCCLGEYEEAKEYHKKALSIRQKIGDKRGEASSYGNLGVAFLSLDKIGKATEYHEKALAIRTEIGDKKGEASSYGNLGTVFRSLGDHEKAKEYHEKALAIRKKIVDKEGEAADYGNLGGVFLSLGEYDKAKGYLHQAIEISKETGNIEAELRLYQILTRDLFLEGNVQETLSNLFTCIHKCESMRSLLEENDKFKICLLEEHILQYRMLSEVLCAYGSPSEALYVVELGRASALADLMSALYGVEKQISLNPKSWAGLEEIIANERNCTCLYISYVNPFIFLWALGVNKSILFRRLAASDCAVDGGSIRNLEEFLAQDISFKRSRMLPQGHCEDRSLFCAKDGQPTEKSFQEGSPAVLGNVELDDEENQEPEPSLSLFYTMIIAPVVHLLQEPEIIIVPDRSLYSVPFAALRDENGKYLSQSFRIRIAPSLTFLKLIQDSPADYHSETGALIVGEPKVSHVCYKGRFDRLLPLPFARNEAEMIGRLLDIPPLLGEHATKQAVLQSIHSVSLIHFAAHGNAERGEIALAPSHPTNGYSQEDDYLLTMLDISKVRLRAKLVVLSCCHSGSGQVRAEGIVGIARAFLGSGARSVLVSLWALDDKGTEQFMSRFYEHLARGQSASESLHQAMTWMRGKRDSKVKDWAPFMLIGDDVTFDFEKLKERPGLDRSSEPKTHISAD